MARRVVVQRDTTRAAGETVFTDPRKAAAQVRRLIAQGAKPQGTRAIMASVGIQPHHTAEKMSHTEGRLLANTTDAAEGPVAITRSPTPSSNPKNPRTAADGYDPVTQRLHVEWGDGGVGYYYYDVPPQVAKAYFDSGSPGRFINQVLNNYMYGPIG